MERSLFLLSWICIAWLASCSPKAGKSIAATANNERATHEGVPDYSDLYFWAAHPDKLDPSDSIPAPLKAGWKKDSTVDVFFIHPTTLTSRQDSSWNGDLNDPILNAKTDNSTILYQASVFNEFRVFAPRYRQAHIRSYYTRDTAAKIAFDLAYSDVKQAFEYYLQHVNAGRPFIIASHSQGTTHAERLLKEFFDKKEPDPRLVAAYIPGMYIPQNFFTYLKPCNTPGQTGCFAGWRTFKKGYEPEFVTLEKGTGVVTNPLTWSTSEAYASYTLNKGGVTTQFNQVRKEVVDAQIHDGILWINRPHIPGSIFLKMKNFHVGDINLFYMNIRENARERVAAFRQLNAGSVAR